MAEHPTRDVMKIVGNIILKFVLEVSERKTRELRAQDCPWCVLPSDHYLGTV